MEWKVGMWNEGSTIREKATEETWQQRKSLVHNLQSAETKNLT